MRNTIPKPIVAGVAALLLIVGAAAAYGESLSKLTTSQTNIDATFPCPVSPTLLIPCAPPLYKSSTVDFLVDPIKSAKSDAIKDIETYLASNPSRNDKQFVNFVVDKLGNPPSGILQQNEINFLHQIGKNRTKKGLKASSWMESHGGKDVWNWYKNQLSLGAKKKSAASKIKKEMKFAESLSNAVVKTAKPKYSRVSPYQVDPTIYGQNQKKFAGKTKFSYPSSHAVIAAAQTRVLIQASKNLAKPLEGLELQIDYSRLYAGGHYQSDVTRGTYAGELIGQYVIHWLGSK